MIFIATWALTWTSITCGRTSPRRINGDSRASKYYRITGPTADKQVYQRGVALHIAGEHAAHFLGARLEQVPQARGNHGSAAVDCGAV